MASGFIAETVLSYANGNGLDAMKEEAEKADLLKGTSKNSLNFD